MKIKELIELGERCTPGPWYADLGNWQVESRNSKTWRDGICDFCPDSRIGLEDNQNPISPIDDAEYIAAACPHNLLPILKCAEKMAEALRIAVDQIEESHCNDSYVNGPPEEKALIALKEWDELNK